MAKTFEARLEEACAWAAQVSHDDADWAGFTAWLEAHPDNARAYDQVLEAETALEMSPTNDLQRPKPAATPRTWRLGAGVAAVVTVVALATTQLAPRFLGRPVPEAVATYQSERGATRTLELANGVSVQLDRGSEIAVAQNGDRVSLIRGAAYFDVRRHDRGGLVVLADGLAVRDIGTSFEVARRGNGDVAVTVASGRVEVAQTAQRAKSLADVNAGERLDYNAGSRTGVLTQVDPQDVSGWRSGILRYQDAPLSVVAADVSRYAGRPVTADPRVANLRFSGALEIGDGSRLVERLQQFLPIEARRGPGETVLAPRGQR